MTRQTPSQAPVRCGGPGDALDAIPFMLGFYPTESLVMLCLSGPRCRFGPVLRFDLPDPAEEADVVTEALELLVNRTTCDRALLVVYTDEGSADPLAPLPRQELLLEARRQFNGAEVGIRDAVVVRHGRWWSLMCDDPLCCAPEGTVIEHDVPSAVELAYLAAGAPPPAKSRDTIVDSLRHRPSEPIAAELERLGSGALEAGPLLTQLREVVEHAMFSRRRGALDPVTIALLIWLVQHVAVRDEATEIPYADELHDAIGLWQEVFVACPDSHRPQVGAVLAVLAWETGGGALANVVIESVLTIDPGHKLSNLTLTLLSNGIRPDGRETRSQAESRARRLRRAGRRAQAGQRSRPRAGRRG